MIADTTVFLKLVTGLVDLVWTLGVKQGYELLFTKTILDSWIPLLNNVPIKITFDSFLFFLNVVV